VEAEHKGGQFNALQEAIAAQQTRKADLEKVPYPGHYPGPYPGPYLALYLATI